MSVKLGNDWDEILKDEWKKNYYQNLRKKLIREYKNYTIYPNMYDIFNALKKVSYKDSKVVILGQDPYHGKGQAHGYSFSVQKGVKIPPSLLNIYKELENDLSLYIPNHGNLEKWADQGVLLLNSTLTVREGLANSHKDLGWSNLTDTIIKKLNEKKEPLVFLLWGKFAQSKDIFLSNPKHLVIKSAHPSPFSAHRGFFGSHPFSRTNKFLEKNNIKPIDWQIENLDL